MPWEGKEAGLRNSGSEQTNRQATYKHHQDGAPGKLFHICSFISAPARDYRQVKWRPAAWSIGPIGEIHPGGQGNPSCSEVNKARGRTMPRVFRSAPAAISQPRAKPYNILSDTHS